MKKLIALLLSLMLVFSLAACGNNPQAAETEPATSTPVSEETQEPETSEGNRSCGYGKHWWKEHWLFITPHLEIPRMCQM